MDERSAASRAEWNAAEYHRLSGPMVGFGDKVLARLALTGAEHVLDAGCGTGRLTARLRERLGGGRLVALDRSRNMLDQARVELGPGTALVCAALPHLPFREAFDLVFSTATFHWVSDHPALFRAIHRALRRNGRLHAQCGGGANLSVLHRRADLLMRSSYAAWFSAWTSPWEFADAQTTAQRLAAAGFVEIETSTEPAPVRLGDAVEYHDYLTTVIFRDHLAYLPTDLLRHEFIAGLTRQAAADPLPFHLDYWRLNLTARRG